VYVLLKFWQKKMAIPNMNPLSWFMIFAGVGDHPFCNYDPY